MIFRFARQETAPFALSSLRVFRRSANLDACGFPQAHSPRRFAIVHPSRCGARRVGRTILDFRTIATFRGRHGRRIAPSGRPLLRMPPFPGAQPAAHPGARDADSCAPMPRWEEIDTIASQITRARVGGDFWAVPSSSDRSREREDPWARIEADEAIVAGDDEEIAVLAAAANRPVIDPRTRRLHAREDLLVALHRHLSAFDYHDPWTRRPISVSRWIEILGEWRALIDRNREIAAVCGIAAWKQRAVGQLLWAESRPRFVRSPQLSRLPSEKAVAVWPSRVTGTFPEEARAAGRRLIQIEDGFVRSSGLGSHLAPPLSIVVDRRGVYYDPHTESDLEHLLAHADLGPELCARAASLIRFITEHGITKYAVGARGVLRLPVGRRKVLVPGQVADDRSVELGRADVAGTLDLLRRVREAEPQAFIVFKPHPDVIAGLRAGHVPASEAARYADVIVHHASIDALLSQIDAVHVLTSLTGFEALLRGCEVFTHGQPFYAGWGLTRDLAPPIERRGRRLTLEQLAAATLILYPRYLDPVTRLPCPPEILAQRLARGEAPKAGLLQYLRKLQGAVRIAPRTLAESMR
ncbi:capsule biosynthesis protein [Sphingomonas sp. DT-207]|uniref:capsular polysaccharide export protein, LipB/KpsS family n=1 Tax=Sphingomonas sp. DT-207 TaxID=3396167 RepID=UPI003F1C7200